MPAVRQDLPALPRGPEFRTGVAFFHLSLPELDLNWCSFLIVLRFLS